MYDIDFFRRINNAHNASSKKETTLYEIKRVINNGFANSIDYQPDTIVDGVHTPLLVMEYSGSALDGNKLKKIEAPEGYSFNLGSKIECFGLTWLVTNIKYNQEVKLAGQMELCNYVLKWQDDNGNIIEEDCVAYDYNNTIGGEGGNSTINNSDTRREVLIQFNDRTRELGIGKRLYVDMENIGNPKIYKITNIDRVSYIYGGHGFFKYTFTETEERNDTDRPDLMIADYIQPKEDPPKTGDCEITYSGDALVKTGGSSKTFRALFKDSNGNVVTSISPIWVLNLPEDLTGMIIISAQADNYIKVQAVNDNSIVGESFVLKMSAIDAVYGEFQSEIEVIIGGLY